MPADAHEYSSSARRLSGTHRRNAVAPGLNVQQIRAQDERPWLRHAAECGCRSSRGPTSRSADLAIYR